MIDDSSAATSFNGIIGLVGVADPSGDPAKRHLYFSSATAIYRFACDLAPCPAGSYCPSQYRQMSCPAGRYGARSGYITKDCTGPCPAKFYCPAGTATPIPCPLGSICPTPGLGAPIPCAPGSYAPIPSMQSCLLCPPGYIAPKSGASVCDEYCPEGTFNQDWGGIGQANCTLCPAGTYMPSKGAGQCTSCKAGTASATIGAKSSASCIPCPANTFSPAASSICQPCDPYTFSDVGAQFCSSFAACSPGMQPAAPAYSLLTPSMKCTPLSCPPPFAPSSGNLATSTTCSGTPSQRYDFNLLLQQLFDVSAAPAGGARGTAASNSTATVASAKALEQTCRLAIAAPLLPAPPAASIFSLYAVWVVYAAIMLALTIAECFMHKRHFTAFFDKLLVIDIFSSSHFYPVGTPITRYPTRFGGLCTTWALSFLVAFAAYMIQDYTLRNVLTQQSLVLFEDSSWGAVPQWAKAPPPWDRGSKTSISGLQLRLLVSGEPGDCGKPSWWGANGGGAREWVNTTTNCFPPSNKSNVYQHVFTCSDCKLDAKSAVTVVFGFSCQSLLLEALTIPSYPAGTMSVKSAPLSGTVAPPGTRFTTITWTLPPTLTLLVDNTTSLPQAPRLGYVLSQSNLATTSAPYEPLQPASAGVRLTIELPLQSFVASTVLTPIMTLLSLLANLAGLLGLLNIFRTVFKCSERVRPKVEEKARQLEEKARQLRGSLKLRSWAGWKGRGGASVGVADSKAGEAQGSGHEAAAGAFTP